VTQNLHENSYALCGCHRHTLREYNCYNVATQHKKKICFLVCVASYVKVSMFGVKLDKFNMLSKNILIYLTKYLFCHTYIIDYDIFSYYGLCYCICHTYNVYEPLLHPSCCETSRHLSTKPKFQSRWVCFNLRFCIITPF